MDCSFKDLVRVEYEGHEPVAIHVFWFSDGSFECSRDYVVFKQAISRQSRGVANMVVVMQEVH